MELKDLLPYIYKNSAKYYKNSDTFLTTINALKDTIRLWYFDKYDTLYKKNINVDIHYQFGFSDSIGETICAFLNTKGGILYLSSKEEDNDEKRLIKLYKRFNYNPKEWVKSYKIKGGFVVSVSFPKDQVTKIFEFDGKIYHRVNDKNRILANRDNLNDLIKNKRKEIGLPIFSDYSPSNPDKQKVFEDTKKTNNVSYNRIGDLSKNRSTFYKYITLDVALSIFRKEKDPKQIQELKNQGRGNPPQTIRFIEPSGWDDQYERRYYTADYKKLEIDHSLTPKLYATCFTTQKESEPAWQVYTRGKDGLGKRCVQFSINQVALRNELVKNLKDCTIVEGLVKYLSTYEIDTYHLSTDKNGNRNDSYMKRFSNFTLENYIDLLLLKRTAFEYEKEVRIFIIENNNKTDIKSEKKDNVKQKVISLDWLSFLEGIKVDPKCSEIEIKLLQDEINSLIDDRIKSEEDREVLKKKLAITKYDVNEDAEGAQRLKIGETYKQFEQRLYANSKKT